jgi:hypothetical protein
MIMVAMKSRAAAALLLSGLWGCTGTSNAPPAEVALTSLRMDLDPDVASGEEVYACFRFDAGPASAASVHALRWTPPGGAILLHHAMMFATAEGGAAGPAPCEPMPVPVAVLPLYAPGGEDTALPEGVSIVVPPSAASFFVELHLVRLAPGQATTSVDLLASATPPAHLAGWVDDFASVPSLPPGAAATSTAQCRFTGPAHVVASWPHMHRLGTHFEGTIVKSDGARVPLLDVPRWDFEHQPLYLVDGAVDEGDAVETACSWDNSTDRTVAEGSFSTDEMCNQGLVVWPRESATCVR